MKHPFLAILLLFAFVVKAQITDSIVIVTIKTDAVYEGKIIEEVKDRYIRLQEKNGFINRIAFNMITTLKNMKGDVLFKAKEQVVSSPLVQPADVSPADWKFYSAGEYKWWLKGVLVDGTDTTYVRIDFDAEFGTKPIKVRYKDGENGKIRPEDIKQLWVYKNGGAPAEYVSLTVRAGTEIMSHVRLCRLIVEGKCQVLFYEAKDIMLGGAPMMMPMAGGGSMMVGGGGGSVSYYRQYIIRYKEKTYNVAEKYDDTPRKDNAKDFNENYQDIFADCPDVVKKYDADKKYTLGDVLATVNEFNSCLGKK